MTINLGSRVYSLQSTMSELLSVAMEMDHKIEYAQPNPGWSGFNFLVGDNG